MKGKVALVIIAGLVTVPVMAEIIFDPANGRGFVGKGDVQETCGWNNQQLQMHASGVKFTADHSETYEYICEWTTGNEKNRKVHQQHKRTSYHITSNIAFEARNKKQISGFNLTGYGESVVTGSSELPNVGDRCPETGSQNNTGPDKRVTEVIGLTSSSTAFTINCPAQ